MRGAYVIYKLPDPIDSIKMQIFLTGDNCPIEILVSDSLPFGVDTLGKFNLLMPRIETFPPYKNNYGFYIPAIYTCSEFPENTRFLKILFKGEAQLGKVEIIFNKTNTPMVKQ
jgi:hypothetical protein